MGWRKPNISGAYQLGLGYSSTLKMVAISKSQTSGRSKTYSVKTLKTVLFIVTPMGILNPMQKAGCYSLLQSGNMKCILKKYIQSILQISALKMSVMCVSGSGSCMTKRSLLSHHTHATMCSKVTHQLKALTALFKKLATFLAHI